VKQGSYRRVLVCPDSSRPSHPLRQAQEAPQDVASIRTPLPSALLRMLSTELRIRGKAALRLPYNLVMDDCRLKFEKKLVIFRVILCHLYLLSREAFDHVHIFPERHCNEVGDFPFLTLQDMNADIARYRLVIRDSSLIEEFSIGLRLACRYSSVPHSYDHEHLLISKVAGVPGPGQWPESAYSRRVYRRYW
jgi:hypothetical protein